MDEADIAGERMEAEMQRRMAARQWRMLPITGKCWNCDEVIEGARFCDVDCCRDWEARMDADKRNGRG